ncbi:MAG: hypothetical protein AAB855_04590 [Patescibacteria group bacterium]
MNRHGEVTVPIDNHDQPQSWRVRAGRDPAIAQNYNALYGRLLERFRAHSSARAQGKGATIVGERAFNDKELEAIYEQFLAEDVEPLNRIELIDMAREIYHDIRAGYRKGERIDPRFIEVVSETFGRAIKERVQQETLTEELLEDIYKKTYRAFIEHASDHLIPTLQTIYLGMLVKVRTKSYAADFDFYYHLYGDPVRAGEAYTQARDAVSAEQSTLLQTAELPKKKKERAEQPAPEKPILADQVDRLTASRSNLAFLEQRAQEQSGRVDLFLPHADAEHRQQLQEFRESIKKRIALARIYLNQADRELQKSESDVTNAILSLLDQTVHAIGDDAQFLDSIFPPQQTVYVRQEGGVEESRSAQDVMRELLPERRTFSVQWNQLFQLLKTNKSHIDSVRIHGAPDVQAVATRIDSGVRSILASLPQLKTLEDRILSEIVERGEAAQDDADRYRDLLFALNTLQDAIRTDTEALGL